MARKNPVSIAQAIAAGAIDIAEGLLRAGNVTIGAVSKLVGAVPGLSRKDAFALLKQASQTAFNPTPRPPAIQQQPLIGPSGTLSTNLPSNYRYVVRLDLRDTRTGNTDTKYVTLNSTLPRTADEIASEAVSRLASEGSSRGVNAGVKAGGVIRFATIQSTIEQVFKKR